MMKQAASAILLAGGILVVLGSFLDWGACSQEPCDPEVLGLQHTFERSGIDLGWGFVTAFLGAGLLLLGAVALRGRPRRRLVERATALAIFLAVGLHMSLTALGQWAGEPGLNGTLYGGVYLTVIGAIVALIGSALPRARRSSASPAPDQDSGAG